MSVTDEKTARFDYNENNENAEKGVNIGCFIFSLLILASGIVLLIARPPEWGIPGLVVFIIIVLGLSGVKVGWDIFTGKDEKSEG